MEGNLTQFWGVWNIRQGEFGAPLGIRIFAASSSPQLDIKNEAREAEGPK